LNIELIEFRGGSLPEMARLAKRVNAGDAAKLGCYHASAPALLISLIGVDIYDIPFLPHRLKEEQAAVAYLEIR